MCKCSGRENCEYFVNNKVRSTHSSLLKLSKEIGWAKVSKGRSQSPLVAARRRRTSCCHGKQFKETRDAARRVQRRSESLWSLPAGSEISLLQYIFILLYRRITPYPSQVDGSTFPCGKVAKDTGGHVATCVPRTPRTRFWYLAPTFVWKAICS